MSRPQLFHRILTRPHRLHLKRHHSSAHLRMNHPTHPTMITSTLIKKHHPPPENQSTNSSITWIPPSIECEWFFVVINAVLQIITSIFIPCTASPSPYSPRSCMTMINSSIVIVITPISYSTKTIDTMILVMILIWIIVHLFDYLLCTMLYRCLLMHKLIN